MEPEGSLLHSQAPDNFSYPESDKSSPCLPIPLLEDAFYIIFPATPVFQAASYPQVSPSNPACTAPLPMRATRPAYLIFLIWSSD